jgi:hypothetical protein
MKLRNTVRLDSVTSRTATGSGGFTPVWSVEKQGVPCTIQPASTSYALMGQQLRARTSHVVYMRKEMRRFVKQGGVVVYYDNSLQENRYFEILGVYDIAESERYLKLECSENKPSGYVNPME